MSVLALQLLTDGAIALVIGGVPTWFAVSWARKKRNKGQGPWPLAAVLWLGWAFTAYAAFVAPRALSVERAEISLADEPTRELKVALVSDTHLGQFRHADWLARIVARVNALEPDVLLLAGDIASVPAGANMLKPLRDVRAPLGTYAVLGNWDYRAGAVEVRKALGSQGARLLVNRAVQLGDDGPWLVGLDDVLYGKPELAAAMADVPEGATTVVLSHNPDAVVGAEAAGADLVLAGHTHGGQVRLPGVGAAAHLPITIGQKYDEGYFDFGRTRLFITSGVGESTARVRLFNPPVISLLILRY